MLLAAFFSRLGTNNRSATETAENGDGQATTTLLIATVIVLPVATVLQLCFLWHLQVVAPSHLAMFHTPSVIGSLVTECGTVIG